MMTCLSSWRGWERRERILEADGFGGVEILQRKSLEVGDETRFERVRRWVFIFNILNIIIAL
jgi:hypothetical protein